MASAYGYVNLEHLYNTRASQVNVQVLDQANRLTLEEQNRIVSEMFAALVEKTTVAKERYTLPGTGKMQRLGDGGVPRPRKEDDYYDVAYPIESAGDAFGDNIVTRELMTVGEINRLMMDLQSRDAGWLIDLMLYALFNNTNRTFVDKVGPNGSGGLGSLTVKPLANGDTDVYPMSGGVAPATDDHYLAQAGAIADNANPYTTIWQELMEHPVNRGGQVYCYIPQGLVATTKALTSFTEVKNMAIVPSTAADSINRSALPRLGFGDRVLGMVEDCWIIQWNYLPAGYILAHTTKTPTLKYREYDAPSLQGLFSRTHLVDGNHQQTSYYRHGGFGVHNRVGSLAYLIGSGSYSVPSAYQTLP